MKVKAMSNHLLGAGIALTGVLVLSIGLIIGVEFPKLVTSHCLVNMCISTTDHPQYLDWVEDRRRTKFNRIYYWNITNKDGFLYKAEAPKMVIKGPYVYKEYETKTDIVFREKDVKFHTETYQVFDPVQTRKECTSCLEDEQITILNPNYFSLIGKYGSDINFILIHLATVFGDTIDQLVDMSSRPAVLEYFGNFTNTSTLQNSVPSPEISFQPFGKWIALADTKYKKDILQSRKLSPFFTEREMAGIYDVLSSNDTLGVLYIVDGAKNSVFNEFCFENFKHQFLNDSKARVNRTTGLRFQDCGLWFHLEQYQGYKTINLAKFIDEAWRLLCLNETSSCFDFRNDNTYMKMAYIDAIYNYILSVCIPFTMDKINIFKDNSLIITRSQRELALGYFVTSNNTRSNYSSSDPFMPGILQNNLTQNADDLPLNTLFTCQFDASPRRNFYWEEYEGKSTATKEQFSQVSPRFRKVEGYSIYVPPVKRIQVCDSSSITLQATNYDIFIPQLWRRVTFNHEQAYTMNEMTVNKYKMQSDALEKDNPFVDTEGLQNMTGTYGYLSWISIPYFLGNAELEKKYKGKNSFDNNVVFEPITGELWYYNLSFQFSVGIKKEYVEFFGKDYKLNEQETLSDENKINPLPIYWIQRTGQITDEAIHKFVYVLMPLLRASCGCLIGLSLVSGIIILLGVAVAFVKPPNNRVTPQRQEEDNHFS